VRFYGDTKDKSKARRRLQAFRIQLLAVDARKLVIIGLGMPWDKKLLVLEWRMINERLKAFFESEAEICLGPAP